MYNIRSGGLQNVDVKFFDCNTNAAVVNDDWAGGEFDPAALCLFCPTQGNGASNRVADKCTVRKITVYGHVRRNVLANQADSTEGAAIQVSLVADYQTNAAQLNAEDVYVTGINLMVPGKREMEYTHRFKVLKTQIFSLQDTSAFTDGTNTGSICGSIQPFQWNVYVNDQVNFVNGAGSGNVSDIKDISYHIIACRYGGTSSADRLEYNCRVRYTG